MTFKKLSKVKKNLEEYWKQLLESVIVEETRECQDPKLDEKFQKGNDCKSSKKDQHLV